MLSWLFFVHQSRMSAVTLEQLFDFEDIINAILIYQRSSAVKVEKARPFAYGKEKSALNSTGSC